MYPVLSFAFFVFSPKIQEHKQVALPISMHKHISCAALSDWSHIYYRLILKYILSVLTAATVMPVRVKNSTTGAGPDSGKKPVCVQAA
jgi:hypothetical protein